MSFRINLGSWGSVFAVPSKVADEKLKLSSGFQLKVLLYILGHNNEEFTNKQIGEALGMHEDDVKDALTYWVNEGILCFSQDSFAPRPQVENDANIQTKSKSEENGSVSVGKTVTEKTVAEKTDKNDEKPKAVMSRPQKPSHTRISMLAANDKTLVDLLNDVQMVLKKTLSNVETATIVYLYDTCGLSAPVIMMLVEYCIAINKPNARTIERIGVQWADEGVETVFDAEQKITAVRQSNADFAKVASVFGIHIPGTPTAKQLEYANRWVSQWKFSDEMLREAYERCIDTKGEMKFSYIDGILKRWNNENIRNKDELQKNSLSPRKPKKPANSAPRNQLQQKPSYDIESLEKQSIFDDDSFSY